jgi:hypothetical protein
MLKRSAAIAPLLSSLHEEGDLRRAGNEDRINIARRAVQSVNAHGHAPLHSPDQAFSKKIENHMHAISLYFMVYSFVKVHGCVKTTLRPASRPFNGRWRTSFRWPTVLLFPESD